MVVSGDIYVAAGQSGVSADTLFTPSSTTHFADSSADLLLSGNARVQQGATFDGTGTLRFIGPTVFEHGANTGNTAISNEGVFQLAKDQVATAAVNRFTNASAGTWLLEIGGTHPPQHDVLSVDSDARLGGTLRLEYLDGFAPVVGQTFTILHARSVLGKFDRVVNDVAPNGVQLVTEYENTLLRLIAVSSLRCDFNHDDSVDAADISIVLSDWSNPGASDVNSDGTVDASDASVCFSEWTGDSLHHVRSPEPARITDAMLLVGLALTWHNVTVRVHANRLVR